MKNSELIQAATTAHRERTARGVIQEHAQWNDLGPAERRQVFDLTLAARRLEAAAHPDGRSSTALAVLARLSR